MDVHTYGWRTREDYEGHSVKSVFGQYREALEQKFAEQLSQR